MTPGELSLVFGAYFLGSVPFGYLAVKAVRGTDIRTLGSGNIGATNVGREIGRKWGALVFVLDVLKGLVPACAALKMSGPSLGALAGLAAIVGHNWPFFLGFRGGKGVATSCGVFLALFPLGVLISLGVWVGTLALWRYVSLSSMLAGVALLVCALLLQEDFLGDRKLVTLLAALAAVLSVFRHKGNIRKLLQGTETKVGW